MLSDTATQQERQWAAERTQQILTKLEHRGPDGQNTISVNQEQVHLAHTRLAIIELSDIASQPMTSRCQRYSLVFNGEIYNRADLRAQLASSGVVLNSDSDTEALLHWLIKHGQDGIQHLRGMFAFFFWDSQSKTGIAARDPFGIKPFYFHHNQAHNSFSFASEINALNVALDTRLDQSTHKQPHTASSNGVYGLLRLGSFQEPYTLLDNVFALPAGHSLTWQNGTCSIAQYWQPAPPNKSGISTRADAVIHLRKALMDTIAAHFVSDVPVGIFLSGGIDSTALLALATTHYQERAIKQQIHTFSIAFEDPQWNEGDVAQKSADHFGSKHTQWLIKKPEAQVLFKDYLSAMDQPSIDGFNTFCVSKLAHENGYKVVLSGVGGDELFAGYASFNKVERLRFAGRMSSLIWPITTLVDALLWKKLSPKVRRLVDITRQPFTHSTAYFAFRGIFSKREAKSLLDQLNMPRPSKELATRADRQLDNYELEFYMRNQLLRDSDCMSMAWGLELRVPLVDSVFYQHTMQIPKRWRMEYGKKLLIDAVPELPTWVVERPKQGFRFPFDEWLNDDFSSLDKDFVWPEHIKPNPWYRRWAIMALLHSISKLGLTPREKSTSNARGSEV